MISLEDIARIAEVEFAEIVESVEITGTKLRIVLRDESFVDVWVSIKLKDRFGFHWERRDKEGHFYRYDNFPDTRWEKVSTYPYHFHDGSQSNVADSSFAKDVLGGFREFMKWIQERLL